MNERFPWDRSELILIDLGVDINKSFHDTLKRHTHMHSMHTQKCVRRQRRKM